MSRAKRSGGRRLRRALFQIHLWTGLAIGLYLVVVSISGSVLIYRNELRAAFQPAPREVTVSQPRLSEELLLQAAARKYPQHRIELYDNPDDPTLAVTLSVDRGNSKRLIFFDPYSGRALGNALPFGWRATTWLLDLHDNLLAGETGRTLNGIGAILLTGLGATGVVLWWPGVRGLGRALTVRRRADWRRVIWSLHGAMGIWAVAFLLLWGITGIYLAFPEPFMAVVDYLEPFDPESFDPRTGDTVLYWTAYLHFGRFGGTPTKLLWALVGLAPPVLFATGAVMWWNRVLRPRWRARPEAEG